MATFYMSCQNVVLDLLRFIGVASFAPVANDQALNAPGLDEDDVRRAVAAVNSALQTVQKYGPQNLKQGRRSAFFRASTTLVVNVVNGSLTATATTTPPAASLGCSFMIDGDSELNRIMAFTGNAITLLRHYIGTGGATVNCTIYYDCALLATDIQAVLEPVQGRGNVRLWPAEDIDEFERHRNRSWLWGGWRNGYGVGYASYETITAAIGTPARYLVERQRGGIPFLRVSPMPVADFEVTFQAKLRAERIDDSATYLDQTGASDPNYRFTSLANDEIESILLPIARWRFCNHPSFKNAETKQALLREYEEVMSTLKNGQTLASSVHHSTASYR